MIGPQTAFSQQIHSLKYREAGETFDDYCVRYASATKDGDEHFRGLLEALREQRILPAGRQQRAVGQPYQTTAHNCFVGSTIDDSIEGIFGELRRSAMTLRTGGGCGWDFSTLRPAKDAVRGLGPGAYATGPVSFMRNWDTMCMNILSAGHRRGAMMGVLRVDHPDIMAFVNAKQDQDSLRNFNISVAVTDAFMEAVEADGFYDLVFGGQRYGSARAVDVWSRIMERNWDWAEPGVIFIDRVNDMNPLNYCETIAASNPCAEQMLPPNGACLLGSLNIVKYLVADIDARSNRLSVVDYRFDFDTLRDDVALAVRAFDNVIDISQYPLDEQRAEQQAKRRMGLGVTGVANALEVLGHPYASEPYLKAQDEILEAIRDQAYRSSIRRAKERGVFPLFDAGGWLASGFAKTLPDDIQDEIRRDGLRNGLLLSIAPTGTISLAADNVSSGIEPPFALSANRLVQMPDGPQTVTVHDYAYQRHGVQGRTAEEVSAQDHVTVLCRAQRFVDNSVSKTCNVTGQIHGEGPGVSFAEFKDLYRMAYRDGAKGCTTFNINGKRAGILSTKPATEDDASGACVIDPATGARTCDG